MKGAAHETLRLIKVEKHRALVRFHRACSWLDEAEKLDGDEQADHALILQWTALNALYGQWDMDRREPLADRPSWQAFLARMSDLDMDGRLVSLLQDNRGLVLAILGNGYLNRAGSPVKSLIRA